MNQATNWEKDDDVLLSDDLNDLDGFSIKEEGEDDLSSNNDDDSDEDDDDEDSDIN